MRLSGRRRRLGLSSTETFVMKRCLFCALILTAAAAAPALSQPKEDHLLLGSWGSQRGLFSLDWETGALSTIRSGTKYDDVAMGRDNHDCYASAGSTMYRVTPTGTASAAASFLFPTVRVRGMVPDQDGSYVVAGYGGDRIFRVVGSSVRTLSTITRPFAVGRDFDTGHFVVGTFTSPGQVIQVDRVTGRQTTIASGAHISDITAVEPLPSFNGYYAVGRNTPTDGLVILRRDGATERVVNIPDVYALKFDPKRNRLFAASYRGVVYELEPNGSLVRSRDLGTSYAWTGIDVYGSHNVSPSTAGSPGTEATVQLRFNASPSRAYCVALSLGMRPGLQIGSRHQPIRPDVLFFATACGRLPLFTRAFVGTLSGSGTGAAYFTIPAGPFSGTPVYVTASAINPAYPGNIDFGNTAVIRIR